LAKGSFEPTLASSYPKRKEVRGSIGMGNLIGKKKAKQKVCSVCAGRGLVKDLHLDKRGKMTKVTESKCTACNGTGMSKL
jgi:DnaJ-class molecular chaperone